MADLIIRRFFVFRECVFLGAMLETRCKLMRGLYPTPVLKKGDSVYTLSMDEIAEKKHTVLIIDDDDTIRNLSSERLTQEGFIVSQSSDGAKGLALALENNPDLILLDNHMPNMSGYEMLRTLRATGNWGAHVPVIFFTNMALEDESAAADIEAIAPSRYLMKSEVSLDELTRIVKENLGIAAA